VTLRFRRSSKTRARCSPRPCSLWLEVARSRRWERRGIRFTLDQLLAGKFHDAAAVRGRRDEGVMLFGGNRSGLKPVRIVGLRPSQSPNLHGVGDHVGNVGTQRSAVFNGFLQGLADIPGRRCFITLLLKTLEPKILSHPSFSPFIEYQLLLLGYGNKISSLPERQKRKRRAKILFLILSDSYVRNTLRNRSVKEQFVD